MLGAVKHNSAFSTVTRVNLTPHVKKDPSFRSSNNPPAVILQVSIQTTDFKSNDDLKTVVLKKLFHLFSS